MEHWICTICNIQMHIQSREPHLSGKRHAAAAVAYQDSILQATRSQEAPKQWACTTCNIEMQMHDRDSHLSGNRHAMATHSQQERFRVEPGAYFSERNTTITSSLSTKAKVPPANLGVDGITGDTMYAASDFTKVNGASAVLVWQCMTCGCCVPLSVKQLHLSSLDHVQKLLEIIKITCMAIPQQEVQGCDNDLEDKKKLIYQDVVNGSKSLVAYLINQTSYKEATAEFSAISPSLKSTAQSDIKSKPDIPSIGPLDAFFFSFSGYKYDPSIPPAESFDSFKRGLKRWNDWDGIFPNNWENYEKDVYTRYQAALTKEFNLWFGTEDDIRSWHSLCRAIAISPLPPTCEECREAVRHRHVNIVDLLQWAREREVGQVRIFKTVKELSEYSYEEKKLYRKDQSEQGVVLRHLLRHLNWMKQV